MTTLEQIARLKEAERLIEEVKKVQGETWNTYLYEHVNKYLGDLITELQKEMVGKK